MQYCFDFFSPSIFNSNSTIWDDFLWKWDASDRSFKMIEFLKFSWDEWIGKWVNRGGRSSAANVHLGHCKAHVNEPSVQAQNRWKLPTKNSSRHYTRSYYWWYYLPTFHAQKKTSFLTKASLRKTDFPAPLLIILKGRTFHRRSSGAWNSLEGQF